MKLRCLGELHVGAIGLGCMGMSEFYGAHSAAAIDRAEAIATIHRALDHGVTMLDTADIYGFGANETLVGEAVRGRRDAVTIATKFGILKKQDDPAYRGIDSRPEYVRAACDASLARLGTDCIGLYYVHRADPSVPIEETVQALAQLVREGKVRHIGLSNVSAETLRRAHAVHPIAAVQNEYSLWCREPEDDLLPACRALGVGFVPYAPLGRGFLSDELRSPDDLAPDDFRRGLPRFQGANLPRNFELAARVAALAAAKGCAPSQLALAWVLAQGDMIVPIPGTKRRKYLNENVAAADLILTPDELALIEAAAPRKADVDATLSGRSTVVH